MDANKFPFPQADDFNKIVRIVNIEDEFKLEEKGVLKIILGDISDRQVQYYISACQYLGLIDKNKHFTDLAKKIRILGESDRLVEFAKIIVSCDIFGTVYFQEKLLETKLSHEEVIELMHKYVHFESSEMFKRRSQTIIKWIEWINKNFNDEITFKNN